METINLRNNFNKSSIAGKGFEGLIPFKMYNTILCFTIHIKNKNYQNSKEKVGRPWLCLINVKKKIEWIHCICLLIITNLFPNQLRFF